MALTTWFATRHAAQKAAWPFNTYGSAAMGLGVDPALAAGAWFLSGLAGSGDECKLASATWLDTRRGYGQDQITTPEPATLLLLGTGLVGLAARPRRRCGPEEVRRCKRSRGRPGQAVVRASFFLTWPDPPSIVDSDVGDTEDDNCT